MLPSLPKEYFDALIKMSFERRGIKPSLMPPFSIHSKNLRMLRVREAGSLKAELENSEDSDE